MSEISLRIVDPAWWQLLMTLPVLHDVTNHPWMLRVVDLPAAVAARGWPAAAHLTPFTVDLEVVDEHAPWQARPAPAGRRRRQGGVRAGRHGRGPAARRGRSARGSRARRTRAMLRRAGLLDGDPADAHLLDLLTGAPHPVRMADSF